MDDDGILKEIKEREIEKGRGDQVVHEGCFDDIRPASAAADEGREVAWKEMHVDWPIVHQRDQIRKGGVEEQPLAVDRGCSRALLHPLRGEVADDATSSGGSECGPKRMGSRPPRAHLVNK